MIVSNSSRQRLDRINVDRQTPYLSRLSSVRRTMKPLAIAACISCAAACMAAPVVTVSGHFTDRFGANPLPLLPEGTKVQLFVILDSDDQIGSPTISVTATQGATTLTLDPAPNTGIFTEIYGYYKFIDFDPGLTGAWMITPTDSTGTGPSTFTNAIPDPEQVPLVTGISVDVADAARVSWSPPNLNGFDVDGIGVRIFEAATGDPVYQSELLPVQTTHFDPPADRMQVGVNYLYWVNLIDEEDFGVENSSKAFSQTFRYGTPGDFDFDNDVDAADLAQWQGDFGQNGDSDADNDNDSDGADFLAWQRGFSDLPSAPGGAVSEPSALAIAAIAVLGLFGVKRSAALNRAAKHNV
jgi:hypothetical protein